MNTKINSTSQVSSSSHKDAQQSNKTITAAETNASKRHMIENLELGCRLFMFLRSKGIYPKYHEYIEGWMEDGSLGKHYVAGWTVETEADVMEVFDWVKENVRNMEPWYPELPQECDRNNHFKVRETICNHWFSLIHSHVCLGYPIALASRSWLDGNLPTIDIQGVPFLCDEADKKVLEMISLDEKESELTSEAYEEMFSDDSYGTYMSNEPTEADIEAMYQEGCETEGRKGA